jgi:hypothetical protein
MAFDPCPLFRFVFLVGAILRSLAEVSAPVNATAQMRLYSSGLKGQDCSKMPSNLGDAGGKQGLCFPRHINYFYAAGAFTGAAAGATGAAGAGSGARDFFTESESLSVFATNNATCQACVSVNAPLNAGIPVRRIPFDTFQ